MGKSTFSVEPVTEQRRRRLQAGLLILLAGQGSGMDTKMGWWNLRFRGSTATIRLTSTERPKAACKNNNYTF